MDQLKNAKKKSLRRASFPIEVILEERGKDVVIRGAREVLRWDIGVGIWYYGKHWDPLIAGTNK